MPLPAALRAFLTIASAILAAYGIGMILFPQASTAFWPWAIDDLHARIYSGFFLSGAVGGVILLRGASPLDLRTLGLAQVTAGVAAILGLVIVDSSVHRVNWSTTGTWLWIAGFGILLIAGVVMVWQSFQSSAEASVPRFAPEHAPTVDDI